MIHKYIDRIKLAKVIKSEIYLLLFSFENKTKKDPTNGKKYWKIHYFIIKKVNIKENPISIINAY